jgi:hypothetical protein
MPHWLTIVRSKVPGLRHIRRPQLPPLAESAGQWQSPSWARSPAPAGSPVGKDKLVIPARQAGF